MPIIPAVCHNPNGPFLEFLYAFPINNPNLKFQIEGVIMNN